jgi:acyl-CoA synthetase (AMP-forming)/AMP-acid ligase II/acyl carrier protein
MNPSQGQSLVEVLRQHASTMGNKCVFRFLRGNGEEEASLTYQSLHEQAMAIAAELQGLASPGERALLLFPAGLDFISAFFGCLYAGIIAVPVAIPHRNRRTASVEAIFEAAKPALLLSTADHREQAKRTYAAHSGLSIPPWIAVDRIGLERQNAWRDLRVEGQQTALLQFTSGSTALPKGVILSHHHLLHMASLIQEAFHTRSEGHGVSWLPPYHDMGLIGGIIQPLYCGGSSTLMAPATFLQRPALWLETISRTGAIISGGPDFAYDLCVRRISATERAQLDLSHWEVAFLGAERIRPATIQRFANAFGPCGFRRESLFPCYGLAEATLMVTGGPWQTPPVVLPVRSDSLARNQAEVGSAEDSVCRVVVGCGENLRQQRIRIVDPSTCLPLADGNVGEIWVQGPSVAAGYYENPHATATTFQARLAGSDEGPFLRTGDLGFIHQKQLYVTGRLKNLIIIRGRNHYPEDIEPTIDTACAGLRLGYCAAFSIEVEDRDELVVVQEVDPRHRDLDPDAAIVAIRTAIAAQHDLDVYAVVLVKAGTVPKTSSGKTRRAACRDQYLHGKLEIVAAWEAPVTAADYESLEAPPIAPHLLEKLQAVTPAERLELTVASLRQQAAQVLALDEAHLSDPRRTLNELGFNSLTAVEFCNRVSRSIGRRLDPTVLFDYPTLESLAGYVLREVLGMEPADESVDNVVGETAKMLDAVEIMSEDEMDALVTAQLGRLQH